MFDDLPDSASVADLDDAAVVAGIEAWTAATAVGAGHRLRFVGELFRRRFDVEWETDEDACDAWDSVAAEISAASGISQGRASTDMEVGAALCSRLPKVAALLLLGQISEYLARTVVGRTVNVQDRGLLDKIDTDVVAEATSWGVLSKRKLEAAIDWIVDTHDPGGVKQTRQNLRDRRLWFGETKDGLTEFGGWMDALDAEGVKQRVELMAKAVCQGDPRTLAQRRVDAVGALGAGSFHLQCRCGSPTCPAAAADDGRAANVVVHVYVDEETLTAPPDPYFDGDGPLPDDGPNDDGPDDGGPGGGEPEDDRPGPESNGGVVHPDEEQPAVELPDVAAVAAEDAAVAEQDSDPAVESAVAAPAAVALVPVRPRGGLLAGFGVIPAALLANKIAAGAKVRYIKRPGAEPEDGYEPLTALAEWVRFRDLWCRFPHCDVPAEFCDLDHVVPEGDGGPTHASNLSPKCRKHHLLKIFHTGWSDVQYPDGTVVWTTPSGRTYTTKPGSTLFFPAMNTTTATIVTGTPRPNSPDKRKMMPKRKRSRAKERAYRIAAARKLNDAHVFENNNPPF